ncbi:TPA: hypothetical protein MBM61_003875 [Klebsiella pneumoniae]|nr:hypothetical protein [Klebsiella pneumoniae]MBU4679157.1 hypothetical protein [Klebsiella pneumoniae subsp. pneumoniae]MBR7265508.1 hypothetical protein [Klebsiella pneumoniae]MBR7296024.1 hypothetical protein [Klebsiella pneumoniae]NEY60072.1 hypothetical protein [Klebsiella pneumoniae]
MGPGSNIYLNLPPRPDNPLILRYKTPFIAIEIIALTLH